MMLTPRIPQGGRWAQMKSDIRQISEVIDAGVIRPGVGTFVIQQTPSGTIIRARPPAEEQETGDEPYWLP